MDGFWNNFWPNFASDVAAGVILAALVAVWISRQQNKAEARERKKKILTLLRKELYQNHRYLSKYTIPDNIKKDIDKIFKDTNFIANKLITENWRAFSDGGELQWINDAELLGQLASAYYAIRNVKETGKAFIEYRYYSREIQGPVVSEMLYGQLKVDIEFAGDEIIASTKKIDEVLGTT